MEENYFAPNIKRYKESKELSSPLLSAYGIYVARQEYPPRPNTKDPLDGLDPQEKGILAIAIRDIEQAAKRFEVVKWMIIQDAINKHGMVSAVASDFKLLAGASAGRLLITISDTKPQGQGKFGGGWISLIGIDGDAGRMGVQGLCATREEALGLLNAATDNLPSIKKDNQVSFI